jgi:hypothetical protein
MRLELTREAFLQRARITRSPFACVARESAREHERSVVFG